MRGRMRAVCALMGILPFVGGVSSGRASSIDQGMPRDHVESSPLQYNLRQQQAARSDDTEDYKVVCYYGGWAVYRAMPMNFGPADVSVEGCTHLIYSFAGLDNDTLRIVSLDPKLDIEKGGYQQAVDLKKRNSRLKVMIAIGGWNEGGSKYSDMVSSAEARRDFVKTALEFVQLHKFDGLDLDWEYPGAQDRDGKTTDKENFVLLVEELFESFSPQGLLLSAAVSPAAFRVSQGYDVVRIADKLDFINVMTYDLRGPWESFADHHAPIQQRDSDRLAFAKLNTIDGMKLWIDSGADSKKLLLGVPFYGRSFTLASTDSTEPGAMSTGAGPAAIYTQEKGFLAYYEVCSSLIREPGWIVKKDSIGSPYAHKNNTWLGFDDSVYISKKMDVVKELGLGGAFIWAIDLDDFRGVCGDKWPLLTAINKKLSNMAAPITTMPPTMTGPTDTTALPPSGDIFVCTSDGYFPDPLSCSAFYQCANGVAHKKFCQDGLMFDSISTICNWPDAVTCAPQSPGVAGRDSLPVSCPRSGNGLFSDPADCRGYVWCTNGHSYRMNCGPYLLFDTATGTCNRPTEVSCQDGVTVDVTRIALTPASSSSQGYGSLRKSKERLVVCYFTNWSWRRPVGGSYAPENLPGSLCSHIIYQNAVLDPNTLTLTHFDHWTDVDNKFFDRLRERIGDDGRLLLGVGGWTDSTGDKYARMASNQKNRAAFIQSALELLERYNLDGLDLQWMFPGCPQANCEEDRREERQNHATLLQELRTAFDSSDRPLQLSAAVAAHQDIIEAAYDVPALNKYLDFVNLMSFDFHGGWESKTGLMAPLHGKTAQDEKSVDAAVKLYVEKGLAKSRLVVGIPFYGQTYKLMSSKNHGLGDQSVGTGLPGEKTRQRGMLAFHEICYRVQTGWKMSRSQDGEPYAYFDDQWTSYEDQQSIKTKTTYINDMALGGAMIWTLDLDDFENVCCKESHPLLKAVSRELRGLPMEPATDSCQRPVVVTPAPPPRTTTYDSGAGSSASSTTYRPWTTVATTPSTMSVTTAPTTATSAAPSSTQTASTDVMCNGNGFAPNPEDCGSYYRCTHDGNFPMSCPSELHFNPTTNLCDWPEAVNCQLGSQSSEVSTTNKTTSMASSMTTATTTSTSGMASSSTTQTTAAATTSSSADNSTPEFCVDGTFSSNHRDCNSFYSCIGGIPLAQQCAPGLHWNQKVLTCDYPDNVGCGTPGTTTSMDAAQTSMSSSSTKVMEVTNEDGLMVVCYFTNWAMYRPSVGKFTPDNIDASLCTHIVYGFATLDHSTNKIRVFDRWADIDEPNMMYKKVTELKKQGKKVLIALGGWNDSLGSKYSDLVNNPKHRKTFNDDVLNFIKEHNFDGLDLDWEYPKCWQVDCSKGPESDKTAFTAWVRELKMAFQPHGYLLSAAVSPSRQVIDQGYDVPELNKYLDWISVMTYDFHGHWDKTTGHVSPFLVHPDDEYDYFNTKSAIEYWIEKGADPSNIVMGMPLYGQSFTLENPAENGLNAPISSAGTAGKFTRAKGFLAYYEICQRQKSGWTTVQDPEQRMGPYAFSGNQWVSFDDPESIKRKTAWIREMKLGGGMIWALDLDDFNDICGRGKYPLLRVIADGLLASDEGSSTSVTDMMSSSSPSSPGTTEMPSEGSSSTMMTSQTSSSSMGSSSGATEATSASTSSTAAASTTSSTTVQTTSSTTVQTSSLPPTAANEYKVVCYFTNWAWYRPGIGKYQPSDIDPDLCTHIMYGFAVLNGDEGVIRPHDSWADLDNEFYAKVTEFRRKGIKVLLALGGWNDSAGDKYSKLVNDPAKRKRFVEQALQFVLEHNFDGLDLDWEYPKCWQVNCDKGPASDKTGFSAWIRELKEAFEPHGLLLTAAVSPNKKVIDQGYEVPMLSKYLDIISVMTYDYHGHWDKKTGHVAPMYYHPEDEVDHFNTNFTINYWIEQGADPKKIVMGIPLYGQSFSLADTAVNGLNARTYGKGEAGQFTRAGGFLAYYEICHNLKNGGWTVVKDPNRRLGPYAYKGSQWVSFDDADMVRFKSNYIRTMGLGGGMIWALDLDDFTNRCSCESNPLLKTINRVLRNYRGSTEDCHIDGELQLATEAPATSGSAGSSTTPASTTPALVTQPPQAMGGGECSQQGDLKPHEDCSKYKLCDNGQYLIMSCGVGLHFSSSVNNCDWPENAGCVGSSEEMPSSTMASSTQISSQSSTIPTTTQKVSMSTSGSPVVIETTSQMIPTRAPITPSPSSEPTLGGVCQPEGSQYASQECEKYYVCVNQQLIDRYCAPNTHYNAKTGQCDWPQNAKCTGSSAAGGVVATAAPPGATGATSMPAATTGSPISTVTGSPQDTSYKVVCYFTNWAWYRRGKGKYSPANIDTSLCSHIVYGFATLHPETFTIRTHDSWADIDNEFYNKVTGLKGTRTDGEPKVLIALGGWNDSLGSKYSQLVNSAANRRRFIDSVVAFIEKYNFDGLDLDWEYPKCWQVDCNKGPDSDKAGFSAWIKELSEEFVPRGWLLSAAVSPNKKVIDAGYNVPDLSRYLDFISVMTYDYHGHWDKKTGHVAPMYYHPDDEVDHFNANFTINYWLEQGADKKKIIMGMPTYGQSFGLTDANSNGLNAKSYGKGRAGTYTRAAGFISYYEICEKVQTGGYTVVKDAEGRLGPYAYKGQDWVSYDDRAMIRQKSQYVKDMGLGGGMIWALDLDDFRGTTCGCEPHPLLRTINRVLRDYSIPEPDCQMV